MLNQKKGQRKLKRENRVTKITLDNLPDEIILKIFYHLGPGDLLQATQVCRRWLLLASDNLLWQYHYHNLILLDRDPKELDSVPLNYWKNLCIKRCIEIRNQRALKSLTRVHPYTGLSHYTNKALEIASVQWRLSFIDNDNKEFSFNHRDFFPYSMSMTVRWFSLQFPSITRIKKMRIHAFVPVFFLYGNSIPNGPYQRALLWESDIEFSSLENLENCVHDSLIEAFIICEGILLSRWKNSEEVAFVTACLHYQNLVTKCLFGSYDSIYKAPDHIPVEDDIDPEYGLHHYMAVFELRNQRNVLWCQRFEPLDCKKENIVDRHIVLNAINRNDSLQHWTITREPNFPWKTELFKGILPNLCILDATILDERRSPIWCISSPVEVKKVKNQLVSFDYDGILYLIEFTNEKGKIKLELLSHEESYTIISLEIRLSLDVINDWFAKKY